MAVGSILSVLFAAVGLHITNEANREQQRLITQGRITDGSSRPSNSSFTAPRQ